MRTYKQLIRQITAKQKISEDLTRELRTLNYELQFHPDRPPKLYELEDLKLLLNNRICLESLYSNAAPSAKIMPLNKYITQSMFQYFKVAGLIEPIPFTDGNEWEISDKAKGYLAKCAK